MPTLGAFAIISLLMALVSVRVLATTVRGRRSLFDHHFTRSDRQNLSSVALFLLLPISVLLHEAGHALTVLAFHAQITGFGYYFFFGYVEYIGRLTAAEAFWIALSGNLVSVVLGLAALLLPVVRPMRPPLNYLLFVFGALDLANALVLYPLMDLVGGFAGDWAQIYRGGTPTLSLATGVAHAALVLALLVAWRSPFGRRLYAARTGLSPDALRRVSRTEAANELLEAGERLASAWKHPLRVVADDQRGASGVTLQWISGGYGRVVGAYAVLDGWQRVEIHGGIHPLDGAGEAHQQPLVLIEGVPRPERLAATLRQALDAVEAWEAPAPRRP